MSPEGDAVRARLQFVDAPELAQAGGPAARDALLRLSRGGALLWRKAATDAYGRELGALEVAGEDVALALLGEGWAWHYRRYAQEGQPAADYRRYQQAEADARQARRGLWADPAAEPPWRWRHRHRRP
ncbi:thermonuclease family protein [Crenobacter sp. HX-7-9]|uniref:Thermonuclease family protein n=1 Tax=Crenobacter caeni TaxID=2705474 RepID=A0A6B2KQC0_9NEIS|nr:thermonuclease family protein [Crenobacter caeni]